MRRIYNIFLGLSFICMPVAVVAQPPLVTLADRPDATADYKYLRDEVLQQWPADSAFTDEYGAPQKWWESFNDPLLDSLVTVGMERNFNVYAAARRIRQSQLQLMTTQAGYLPTVGLTAGWSKEQSSGLTASSHGKAVRGSTWDLGLNLSWEIDVFGRIYSQANVDRANYRATRAEYAATMLELQAQIALQYNTIRTYQEELRVAHEHATNELKAVNITKARLEAGLASMLDVSQAETVYYSTLATIPGLENSIRTAINSLGILLGEYPQALYEVMDRPRVIPDYRRIVKTGVPADLLRRRPDVSEAAQQLYSSLASVGVARKDYLPMLSLNGTIGTEAHAAKDLFKGQSYYWSIEPTLSWTIFDGMKRRYSVESAKQQVEIDIANYNEVVLTAVQEVDNAMSTYINSVRYISALEQTIDHCEKSYSLSLDLYKRGLSTFTNVVDAQISLLNYQNELVAAKGQALSSLVDLYKALGGGFNSESIQ